MEQETSVDTDRAGQIVAFYAVLIPGASRRSPRCS